MPLRGGELRIEGVRDHNSPDEVGPPVYHDPVSWDGWIRYHHESTFAGAGMSYVRGQVLTEDGRLMASFTQDAMIRAFQPNGSPASMAFESRLCGGTL